MVLWLLRCFNKIKRKNRTLVSTSVYMNSRRKLNDYVWRSLVGGIAFPCLALEQIDL